MVSPSVGMATTRARPSYRPSPHGIRKTISSRKYQVKRWIKLIGGREEVGEASKYVGVAVFIILIIDAIEPYNFHTLTQVTQKQSLDKIESAKFPKDDFVFEPAIVKTQPLII